MIQQHKLVKQIGPVVEQMLFDTLEKDKNSKTVLITVWSSTYVLNWTKMDWYMVRAGNFGQKSLATISDAPYKYMY